MTTSKKIDIYLSVLIIFCSGICLGTFIAAYIVGWPESWYLLFLFIVSLLAGVKCLWWDLRDDVDKSNEETDYDPYKDIQFVDVNEEFKNNNL